MRTYFIILISLLISIQLKGQNLEESYAFAEKAFIRGQYELATETFERVFFFDSTQIFKSRVAQYLSETYYQNREFEKSNYYIDLSYNLAQDDSIKCELILKKALNLFLLNEYQYALVELMSLPDDLSNGQVKTMNFYYGLNYFQLGEFDNAEKSFSQCFGNGNYKKQIKALFNANKKIKEMWPRKAQYLSMFVPGLGQLLDKSYQSAVNSFILTGSLYALYIYTIVNYSLVDGILSIMPWFMRYYRGGYENAYRLAENQNLQKRQNILQEIIQLYEKEMIQ